MKKTLILKMVIDEDLLDGFSDFENKTKGITVESVGSVLCQEHNPRDGYIYWELTQDKL